MRYFMKYDKSKLEEWVSVMPNTCRVFLDNFFISCRDDPPIALANYIEDISSYSLTHRSIRKNARRLLEAFYDVSGLRVEDN